MKRIVCAALMIALVFTTLTSAHPGNTDSAGGHTCRTNCGYWGYNYDEYHYHGGYSATPDYYDQGYTFGSEDAIENNHDVITSGAMTAAREAAQSDFEDGEEKESFPSPPDSVCEMEFNFRVNEYDDYIDGVNDGWGDACPDVAEGVYSEAYNDAYDEASEAAVVTSSDEEDSLASGNEGPTDWFTAASAVVMGAFFGIPLLIGVGSSMKEWWDKL